MGRQVLDKLLTSSRQALNKFPTSSRRALDELSTSSLQALDKLSGNSRQAPGDIPPPQIRLDVAGVLHAVVRGHPDGYSLEEHVMSRAHSCAYLSVLPLGG